MPFNMGFGEVLIILVVVLLLFGAKRIPEIAGSLGKGINSFKKNLSEVEGTFKESVRESAPLESSPRRDPLPGGVEPVKTVRPDDAERPEPKRLLS
jgi:sec-independent protein translocase protein TatA